MKWKVNNIPSCASRVETGLKRSDWDLKKSGFFRFHIQARSSDGNLDESERSEQPKVPVFKSGQSLSSDLQTGEVYFSNCNFLATANCQVCLYVCWWISLPKTLVINLNVNISLKRINYKVSQREAALT